MSHAHEPHAHEPHAHAPAARDGDDGSYYALATAALRELLIERGLISAGELRRAILKIESPGVHLGARLVARAWTDPAFKARLLEDGKTGCAELGLDMGEAQLIVVENTAAVHNVIVCTLCSCYPRSILGQPPAWYTSKAYRARTVREPRAVLREFGTDLPDTVELRVHDSNADMRYLVLPLRPAGTAALDEAGLAALVTRDSLIGVTP